MPNLLNYAHLFKTFIIDCSSINFDINYLGNYYKFYYSSDNSNPFSNVYDAKFFDSLTFRGNNYAKVLLLKDNPQTFNVFYNKQGILRYVIDSDTFDLR